MWSSLIHSIGLYPNLFETDLTPLEEVLCTSIEKRDTNHRTPTDTWHREELDAGAYSVVMVWANMHPTELLLPTGDIVIPKPYELILFDNKRVLHRPPRNTDHDLEGRRFIIARIW